jgi:hypothetical protein
MTARNTNLKAKMIVKNIDAEKAYAKKMSHAVTVGKKCV